MPEDIDLVEAARIAVRARDMKITPYRVGIEMGRSYIAGFKVWSANARDTRDYSNRPEAPACPYANRHSVNAWREGFKREVHS